MSSGLTHAAINLGATAIFFVTMQSLSPELLTPTQLNEVTAGLLFGTVLITPDIDMKRVRTLALQAWGPLKFLWWPLLQFSKHRGVSHTYLRGPLIRFTYICVMLSPVLWALTRHLNVQHHWRDLLTFYLGYLAAQWLHLMTDRIPPSFKRL